MAYNPVEAAEALQSIDQQTLNTYMKNPPPGIPAYQVAAEVARRADMAKRFAALQAKERTDQQTGTVIEDVMKALNPGSVNPVPANPSQLASRPIPSNITGANAPMSPPAMQPPVNAGIASGMQAQPALSPQVMQAAGGTMGNTVYAQRGRVPSGSVYNRGSDALEKALEMARKEGRLYSKSDRSLEGDLKNPFPEQELKRRAMLAFLTKDAVAEKDTAYGGMGASAVASNGTQGRTVYAQFGYPTEKVPEASTGVVPLTREEFKKARDMGARSIADFEARKRASQQQAEFTRRGGPDFTYPHDPSASSGAELLAREKTRKEMIGLGVNPDSPGAVVALADAKQGELDAAQAYREAQAERGTLGGELPRAALLEAQVRQREGEQLEARREADRIASLTPEHEALRMALATPTPNQPPRHLEDVVREVDKNRTEVGLTDRSGRPIMPPEKAFDYLLSQPDAMVRPHVGKAINDYFAGLPLGVHEENIEIKSNLLESLEGGVPPQEVLQKFEAAKGDILKSTENYSARMSQAFKDNVGVVNPQLMEGPLNKVRFLNRESSPGSVVNAFYDAQKEGLKGLELAPAHDAYAGGAGSGLEARRIAKRQVDSAVDPTNQESTFRPVLEVNSGSGILTDPKAEVVSEVDPKVVPEVVPEVVSSETRRQNTVATTINTKTAPSNDAPERKTDRDTIKFLDAVDSDKIRSDTYAALSKDSQEAFKRIEGQFDELKKYDPKADIKDIQQRRMDRIKQIKFDTNTQRLLAASAAFLSTSTFYEGFGKAMEGIGDLSKEEQKQVLALQDKIDESDLTARAAYVEHQAKMTSMENNLLAAKMADQRGNSEEASRRAALAVAERAAANDLLYKAEQLANARIGHEISRLAYTYKKPSDAKVAIDEFITNQWRVLTPEQKVEFGWPPGATTIGQLDFNKAADKIGAYLKKVMPKSTSGGYAEINYRDRVAKDARSEIESIQTGFDKAWKTAGGANSTLDLKRIAALTGMPMPEISEGSNMLSAAARRNTEIMGAVQDYMAWESYRRNANNPAVTNEILRLYPNVIAIERRISNMDRAAGEGGVEGGEGSSANPADFVTK